MAFEQHYRGYYALNASFNQWMLYFKIEMLQQEATTIALGHPSRQLNARANCFGARYISVWQFT